jgi:hypothetical protein
VWPFALLLLPPNFPATYDVPGESQQMELTPQTKLSQALTLHPDVLAYVVSLNPHDFDRLTNPLMYKLMPPRITLARLAVMVDMPVDELIANIYCSAHQAADGAIDRDSIHQTLPDNPTERPDWVTDAVADVVDLLEADARLDTDPFVPLFPAIKHVEVGDVILLKHKWEPQPLYDVWQKLGVEHYAVQQSADEWWVYLRKTRSSYRSSS